MSENYLTKEQENLIINEIADKSFEEIEKIEKQQIIELKSKAKLLKKIWDETDEKVQKVEIIKKRQAELRNLHEEKAVESTDEYIELEKERRNLNAKIDVENFYSEFFRFQEFVNNLLGQEVKMLYVHRTDDGQNVEIYEMKNEDIVSFSDTYGGRYILSESKINNLVKLGSLEKIDIDKGVEDYYFDLRKLKNAYLEICRRLDLARATKNKYKLLLWKPKGRRNWYKMWTNRGDASEVYAQTVFLNRKDTFPYNLSLEENIDQYTYDLIKVDTENGFFSGDFSKDDVEYGVKAYQGSTLKIAKIKKVVNEIINDKNYNLNKLKEKKKEWKEDARERGSAKRAVNQQVDKDLAKLIKQIRTTIPDAYKT